MFMLCLVGMCHAPAPSHHRLLPRANSCRALFPNPITATLRNRTSDPDTLSILSLLAFHPSPQALAVTLSFPHRPSPILATFLSTTCVLKRFLLTSPRKLALTCVKRPVLRTSGWTCRGGVCDEAVMKHCLFLPKISIFGHEIAGLV